VVALSTLLLVSLVAVPPVGTPLLAPQPITPPVGAPQLVAPAPLLVDVPARDVDEPAKPATEPAKPSAEPAQPATIGTIASSGQVESSAAPSHPMFGAEIDAGLPEGFGGSLVFRPWYFVRAHVGGVTNTASGGIRGGVTLIPFRWYLTPTLSGEIGHLFEGNLNGTLSSFLNKAEMPEGMLDRVSYTFYTAQLGLEIGAPDRFIVYLRGGLSRVEAVLRGPPQVKGNTTVDPGPVNVGLTIPSAKLGLLLYF
jgi:hypothetical protein